MERWELKQDVGKTQAEILLCIKKKRNSDKGYNLEKKKTWECCTKWNSHWKNKTNKLLGGTVYMRSREAAGTEVENSDCHWWSKSGSVWYSEEALEVNGGDGHSAMNRLHATEFHVLCILHNKSNFKRREQPKRFASETPTWRMNGGQVLEEFESQCGVHVSS